MFRRLIKIFLASPGDLVEERKAARQIINEENKNHAQYADYQLELVGWEDTVSQFQRAQQVINRDLEQCEYFIGLMWKKWGTPPGPDGHPYSSGFEEEFRLSVGRFNDTGKPEIALLFKKVSSELAADAGPELAKVLAFKKEIQDKKAALYQEFDTLRDFEEKFRAIVSKFLRDQIERDLENDYRALQSPAAGSTSDGESRPTQDISFTPIDANVRSVFAAFSNLETISATTVARLRLLGAAFHKDGNDEIALGAHDANLIFREVREKDFSTVEVFGLIKSGLLNIGSGNVLNRTGFAGDSNS